MKTKYFVFSVTMVFILAQCATQKKIEYDIPENLAEESKAELMVRLEKGVKLYKLNCTQCHGIFTKGKDNIPNFTDTQLDVYKKMYKVRDPKNHAFVAKMPLADLDAIMKFLQLRKKA